MSSNRIASLLAWCSANSIVIDPRIEVVEHDMLGPSSGPLFDVEENIPRRTSYERCIRVRSRHEHIDSPCTLVHIPKTAVLSTKSCFISLQIAPIPYGHGAHLALALALYGELLRGSESRWFGYLQSLPDKTVDIATLWGAPIANLERCVRLDTCPMIGDHEDSDTCDISISSTCSHCARMHDGRNAKAWLEATEAEQELRGLLAVISQYYTDFVEPTLRRVSILRRTQSANGGPEDASGKGSVTVNPGFKEISLSGFCHAYSLVSSRAFWVDAYHGLSMVPIADAFNHVNEYHLHMESDYDVCVECGSLAECEHDREGENQVASSTSVLSQKDPDAFGRDEVDHLEMRTVRPVPPHSEVFNTYGSLSNAALLTRYGFMLPENEFDTIKMVSQPLSSAARTVLRATKPELTMGATHHPAARCRVGSESHCTRHKIGGDEGGVYIGGTRWGSHDSTEPGTHNDDDGITNDALPLSTSTVVSDGEAPVQWTSAAAHEDLVKTHRKDADVVGRFICIFSRIARVWCAEAAWDERDEGLVCNLETSRQDTSKIPGCDEELQRTLLVNADGKISHHLWLFCALAAVFSSLSILTPDFLALLERVENEGGGDSPDITELKHRLVKVQRYIESLRSKYGDMDEEVNDEDEDDENDGHHSLPSNTFLCADLSISCQPPYDHAASVGFSRDVSDRKDEDRAKPFSQAMKPLTCTIATSAGSPPARSSSNTAIATEIVTSTRTPIIERTRPRDFGIPNVRSSPHVISQAVSSLTHILETPTYSGEASPKPVLSLEQRSGSRSDSLRGSGSRNGRSSPCEEEERPNKRARGLSDLLGMYEDSSSSSPECDDPRFDGSSNTTPVQGANTVEVPEEMCGSTRRRTDWYEKNSGERDERGLGVAEDHHLALGLARVVVFLCRERCRPPTAKRGQYGAATSAAKLGDILDEIPSWMWRTRCALLLAVSERSVLESCAVSWSVVLEASEGAGG